MTGEEAAACRQKLERIKKMIQLWEVGVGTSEHAIEQIRRVLEERP